MTTVINRSPNGEDSDGVMGIVVGIIILVMIVGIFFVYALPAMRDSGASNAAQENAQENDRVDVNVTMPANERETVRETAPMNNPEPAEDSAGDTNN